MARRYALPKRIRLHGDEQLAATYIKRAEVLLGALVSRTLENNRRIARQTVEENGVIYELIFTGLMATIDITVPALTPATSVAEQFALWIPRGFVVQPVSDVSPYGWGMPIVQASESTPFDTANLAPGLDVTRWTRNGPLSQVLLSAVPSAGYPTRTYRYPPMYFSTTAGNKPKFDKSAERQDVKLDSYTTSWAAYRLEFTDYQDVAADSARAYKRELFTLTNQHRAGLGLTMLNPPLRGYYLAAQDFAEQMSAHGYMAHYNEHFDATYRTPADRVSKDGLPYVPFGVNIDDRNQAQGWAENAEATATAFADAGTDPDGGPIVKVTGASVAATPLVVFNNWLSSAPHRHNIEGPDYGVAAFLDNGTKTGYASQDYTVRDLWIQCGNASWISQEPEVPPLSWHSFYSTNVTWETFPMEELPNPSTGVYVPTAFVEPDASCWLNYVHRSPSTSYREASPGLASTIFMRGRAVAAAPHNGLVWGACVQKLDASYRLIALVHHDSEQFADKVANGATAKLHVWYADLPDVQGFAANPESVVRGVYGSPVGVGTWPWIDAVDPWSWHDAGIIDVGTTGTDRDLLKYASMWRFSKDGTRAVCMRDFGKQADYEAAFQTLALNVIEDGPFNGYIVELVFSKNTTATPLTVTKSLVGMTRADTAGPQVYADPPLGSWPFGALYSMFAYAVDYATDNSMEFAYVGTFTANGMAPAPTLQVVGTGGKEAHFEDLRNVVIVGSNVDSSLADRYPFQFQVLDVADTVVMVESMLSRDHWDFTDGGFTDNPNWVPCWGFAPAGVYNVSMYKNGAKIGDKWFGNDDGMFTLLDRMCIVHTLGVNDVLTVLPGALARITQGSFARNRTGQWVAGFQANPQPNLVRKYVAGPVTLCVDDTGFGPACVPTSFDYKSNTATRWITDADMAPRGGWCTSSFASQSALTAMMQIPGDNVCLQFARVV